jgi:hypothetical protein
MRAVAAAQLENIVLWTPGMVVVDRFHPDRRSGEWPPLLCNRRVFAYEVAMHALFGALLGALIGRNHRPRRDFGRRKE